MAPEVVDNKSAKQRHIDREAIGQTASGHAVSIVFDSVDTVSTVGAAGGASALPATPLGYFYVLVAGNLVKVPYYNP
jgi:hypothetical protein